MMEGTADDPRPPSGNAGLGDASRRRASHGHRYVGFGGCACGWLADAELDDKAYRQAYQLHFVSQESFAYLNHEPNVEPFSKWSIDTQVGEDQWQLMGATYSDQVSPAEALRYVDAIATGLRSAGFEAVVTIVRETKDVSR